MQTITSASNELPPLTQRAKIVNLMGDIECTTDSTVRIGLLKSFKEHLENEIVLLMVLNEKAQLENEAKGRHLLAKHAVVKENLTTVKSGLQSLLDNLDETVRMKEELLLDKSKRATSKNSGLLEEFVECKCGGRRKSQWVNSIRGFINKSFQDLGITD